MSSTETWHKLHMWFHLGITRVSPSLVFSRYWEAISWSWLQTYSPQRAMWCSCLVSKKSSASCQCYYLLDAPGQQYTFAFHPGLLSGKRDQPFKGYIWDNQDECDSWRAHNHLVQRYSLHFSALHLNISTFGHVA